MVAKIFDDILLKGIRSGQAPAKSAEAREWYRAEAKTVTKSKANPEQIIKEMKGRYENRFRLGNMYMFQYLPKHRATLPYYDRFPLIFPINRAKGGFLGINMHYLPPILRAKLMDALYETSNNKFYNETTKLKLNYDILNSAAKFNMFKPCVKHYLTAQLKSRLVHIEASEWDVALFLPMARFVGATQAEVFKDSRKIIRGSK
jgi:hypothetical protein|tara:strand:- start:7125 stop:7733 length:609 start_codon:yes stop_codon:yes gene_type:complete